MRARRPGPGELLAGASGLALALGTFLPWLGVDASFTLPGGGEVTVADQGRTAWDSFALVELAPAAALARQPWPRC